jgi:uncharacterized protein (TIGR02466 family)
MKQLNILNYPIYKFENDLNLNQEIFNNLEKLQFRKVNDEGSSSKIYPNYFHEKLFNFFESCILQLKNKYFYDHLNFPIVDCWANKYNMMQTLRNHTHSNSVISGLYYVTTHANNGATCFGIPDPWTSNNVDEGYDLLKICKRKQFIQDDIYPSAGVLLLFPGHMSHHVKTLNKPHELRYTIAFNAFPSGNIGLNDTGKLTIETVSLRQRLGK